MCRRGHDVLFKKTYKLLNKLSSISATPRFERFFRKCIKVDLLILDDFLFTKIDQKQSEMLYAIADERIERGSIIMTSNRPPQDWFSMFPDPVIGNALLDRLVSGAIKIITTKGDSFRKESVS